MAAEDEMRFRLQQVGAYRMLCRSVRRSGRENVFFAAFMLFLAFYIFNPVGLKPPVGLMLIFYGYVTLAVGELVVGLFKILKPSAEGILFDGFVLLAFAGWNLGWQGLRMAANARPDLIIIFLGVYLLLQAVGRFKQYGQLRKLFADRPSPELVAWFDGLVHEIRTADPQLDDLALDLPTHPHLKAKLLGTTAFFVAAKGDVAFVAGLYEFTLVRDPVDRGTGKRSALLRVFDDPYPSFEITDASWNNYERWLKANAPEAPRL
ncbi:MAG TPA: hypothetical protein VMZ71_13820 [Gemmataceae bacterium]|nr:hypothetical protein [Gemmataceae bacterium]